LFADLSTVDGKPKDDSDIQEAKPQEVNSIFSENQLRIFSKEHKNPKNTVQVIQNFNFKHVDKLKYLLTGVQKRGNTITAQFTPNKDIFLPLLARTVKYSFDTHKLTGNSLLVKGLSNDEEKIIFSLLEDFQALKKLSAN
jgi:hypothetical protein